MRKMFFKLMFAMPLSGALAAEPSTQCPAGYVRVVEPNAIMGYPYCESVGGVVPVEIERPTSCLVETPDAVCTMFITTAMKFQDDSGEYKYSAPCAMEP